MSDRRWIVLVAGLLLASGCGGDRDDAAPAPPPPPIGCARGGSPALPAVQDDVADEGIEGVYAFKARRSGEIVHDRCPEYDFSPPVDGPMAAAWVNCGFYDRPVSPPHAVHSLYNGAVWIAYDRGLDRRSLDVIRATATRSSHVLASPVEGLPTRLVLSAWQRQLRIDDVDDPRFDRFVSAYLHAPHRPTLYETCRDGTGEPAASFWDGASR